MARMALRRLLLRLLEAAAAARGRAPSAQSAVPRRFGRLLLPDSMAAAGARGQKARACATARVRAIRSGGEAATTAALASARARARAAYAYILRAQRQAAAAVAGPRLRQASDDAIATFLRVLYGDSAPIIKTPTSVEIYYAMQILESRLTRLNNHLDKIIAILEFFLKLDLYDQSVIISYLAGPLLAVAAVFTYMIPSDTVSMAPPEYFCPFIGICGVPSEECTVEECMHAVLTTLATCGGVTVMGFGGLSICLLIDVADFLDLTCQTLTDLIKGKTPEEVNYLDIKGLLDVTCQTVADMIKGETPEEIRRTFNIKNELTPKDQEKLRYLTYQTLEAMIKGKRPEEICKIFNIKSDFTSEEEEKLLKLTCQTVAVLIKGKTHEEICKIFINKNDMTIEEDEEVRKENQWAFE